jgi:glycosyltransferase involved in cell wall biosynthesis
MSCGCPVILGRHSSFPEVAGDAGVYFDLNSSGDLAKKIDLLINNSTLRNEYSLKGLIQIKKFNWQTASQECLDVYKKAYCK